MSNFVRRFCCAARFWSKRQQLRNSVSAFESRGMATASKSGQALEKLREFGYAFNEEGQLRKIDASTGQPSSEPYQFDIYNDPVKNQAHYEELAEQIPEIVYDLLEQNGLSRTYIPEDLPQERATFFFTQPEKLDKPKKLLVLIHGSGYVRAGQWARSLIINNSLDHGTQIPYIKRAQTLGYDILVTNTNDNYRTVDGAHRAIPGLNSATAHAIYVWEKYVMGSQPESVAIVAHSYGGAVTLELAKRYPKFFKEKVFAIALTDSAHFKVPDELKKYLTDTACNWVSSSKTLDTEIETPKGEIPRVSAGHAKHEWTSYSAFESVFKYLEQKYENFIAGQTSNKKAKLDA